MSTATDVRAAIRDAIRGVETSLGFRDGDYTQIHEYLLEHELYENRSDYLKGDIADGTKATRAVGIHVLENETHDQLFAQVVNRLYQIEIGIYCDVSTNGAGVQLAVTMMRVIRQAIKNMTTELSNTVDRVESLTTRAPRIIRVEGLADRQEIINAAILMEALEVNATF